MVTEGTTAETEGATESAGSAVPAEEGATWSVLNWLVIGALSGLTLVGVALSMGVFDGVVAVEADGAGTSPVTVPLFIYLYAGLGALGYVFTKLMVDLEQYTAWGRWEDLVGMAMRVPAAWVLAAGVYLLLGTLFELEGSGDPRFAAGVAFLVGLYVNVALKALGSLADRILGRAPRRSK